jgi:hypothetical protein
MKKTCNHVAIHNDKDIDESDDDVNEDFGGHVEPDNIGDIDEEAWCDCKYGDCLAMGYAQNDS